MRFEQRLKRLEDSNLAVRKPNVWHVHPDQIEKWREILTAATESADWSHYLDDLAMEAPAVYAAYVEAGWCE